jgi:hypothetical protein
MSHLENLIAEYYDWKGYLVKRNIKVGKLSFIMANEKWS